ncbi:MAG: hypothetical protein V3T60_00090 [Candidatus Binatia bacterium]
MNKIPFSVYDFFGYLASGFLLLASADYAFDRGWLATEQLPLGVGVLWLIGAYVLGHLVAHVSSVVLELNFLRKVLGSPEEHLFSSSSDSPWRRIFPGNFVSFPDETKNRILERAKKAGVSGPGRALFLHCHPIAKREQATLERLNTFLNLYGFARNISMTLLLSAVILTVGAIWSAVCRELDHQCVVKLLGALGCLVASYGMFLRYLKFFRHYTVEVFISYAESGAD